MPRKRSRARFLLDTSAVVHLLHGHTLQQAAVREAIAGGAVLVPVFVRMEYLRAVILNLISILATYGLMVLVFQKGYGAGLIGLDHEVRGVASWIPVFLFAFLFGLSMDYEVFLISRMRELRDTGLPTRQAVAQGLQHTGKIVTSAALIMVVAFSGFIMGSSTDLKEFGFGLAAAILIDATVIRALLVPALMRLMGSWNWWLPERVARIARVSAPAPQPVAGEGEA